MKVAVIVLTYNNSRETLDCILSLKKLEYEGKYGIIVVDNASEEKFFKELTEGLLKHNFPSIVIEEEAFPENFLLPDEEVVILKNNKNYGYAGGNNRGIRLAMLDREVKYFWILNNDTVVHRDALSWLIERSEQKRSGFTGSVLLYFSYPAIIQAVGGGKFFPFLGSAKLFMKGKKITGKRFSKLTPEEAERKISYIMGASMLVSREVIEDVGLMDEIFFLYGDELDWQLRAKKRNWRIGVALDSLVYHRESLSIKRKSPFYFYHFSRSSAILIRKHYSNLFLPSSFLFLLLRASSTFSLPSVISVIRGFWDGVRKI